MAKLDTGVRALGTRPVTSDAESLAMVTILIEEARAAGVAADAPSMRRAVALAELLGSSGAAASEVAARTAANEGDPLMDPLETKLNALFTGYAEPPELGAEGEGGAS
jgi:hypothetical protein